MESSNIFSFNQDSSIGQNTSNTSTINIAGSTDIGGGNENQDKYSILYFEFNGHSIRILCCCPNSYFWRYILFSFW